MQLNIASCVTSRFSEVNNRNMLQPYRAPKLMPELEGFLCLAIF